MKIPDIIQTTRDTLRHLALAVAVGASFLAGSAQAVTYANWTFNTGAGADSSGNGHDLGGGGPTATSPTPWGGSAKCSSNTGSGQYGGRYGGVPGVSLPTDNFTLGVWVQGAIPAYSGDQGRSSLMSTNGDGSDSLWIGAQGTNWKVSLGAPGGGTLATFAITPSTPQHIEVTREAGEYSVYLDGFLVAGPTAAAGFVWNSFHVGINSGGWANYRGLFGDVLLTDVVPRSPEAKIKAFGTNVAGSSAVIGTPAGNSAAIAWTVPYGTNPVALAPTFTLSAGASCTTALDGGIAINSGDMFNFTNPVHYVVKASDYDAILNPNYTDYTVTVTVAQPFNFYTGLAAWFDASQLTGLSDGAQVNTWADLSGTHTATKQNGDMKFYANQVNSTLPTVQFRNSAYANISGSMFSKEQYIVFRLTNPTGAGEWGSVLGSQAGNSGYLLNRSGNFYNGFYPAGVAQNGGAPLSPNYQLSDIGNFMIVKITGNSNDTSVRSGWALGRQQGWSSPDMDVAEIIAFDHVLSAADENTVGGYLETKYGLDTAYPAFNLPVPYGLKATPGDMQATLTWPAFPMATGYNLRRSDTPGGPYTVVIPVAETTYTNTGLTNGNTYYYVVTATTGSGETNNSAEASVIPSAVDAGLSSVVAYLPEVWSDGTTASTISVTLRNGGGLPATGKLVTMTHTSGTGSPVLSATTGTTDVNGVATFTVTSNSPGVEGFTATATITGGTVTITQKGQVTFKTQPADVTVYIPTNLPTGGVVNVLKTWDAGTGWGDWSNWDGGNSYDVYNNKVLGRPNPGGQRGAMYINNTRTSPGLSSMSYFNSGIEVTYIGASARMVGSAAYAEMFTWDGDVAGQTRQGFIINSPSSNSAQTTQMFRDGAYTSQNWSGTNNLDGLHTMTLLRLSNGNVQTYVDGILTQTMTTVDPTAPLTKIGFGYEYTGNSYIQPGTIVEQVKAFTVSYPVGAPDAGTSTVAASPATMIADGLGTSTVTVTLKDAAGNRVADKEVTLSYSGPGAVTFTPSTATTGAAGTAVFTVQPTTTTAGIYEFTATVTDPAVVITQKAILNTTLVISTTVMDVTGTGTGVEILNTGTLVAAAANHFGSSLTELTVNGVVFGKSATHLTQSPGGGSTASDGQGRVPSLTDGNDYGKLMRTYQWGGGTNLRLDIPGLTIGKTYRLQWITCSPRGGNISVEGSASVALAPTTQPGSNYPRVFAFTWVATDTTANMLITRQSGSYSTDNEILWNGYALHDMGGGGGGGYAAWADKWAGGATALAADDYNNDGVQNGIAYFMGENGVTTNPGVVGGKVSWKKAVGNAYVVKVSDDLQNWSDAPVGSVNEVDGYVVFDVLTNAKRFARLEVMLP